MSGEPAHAGFNFLVNLQMKVHRSEVDLGLEIFTLRERPDLRLAIFLPDLQSVWPEFMRHDATAQLYFAPSQFEAYLDYAFAGVADGKVVARAFSVPFAFNVDGRDELPDGGWDQVIRWAHEDRMIGRASTALSALEITLVPQARRGGNSIALLNAMKCCARANGYKALFAPVRPNQKHLRPHTSMREYISEMRADGLPADPWLRIHLRAGGRVVKIAPYSMTIIGSIADWSTWTNHFTNMRIQRARGSSQPVVLPAPWRPRSPRKAGDPLLGSRPAGLECFQGLERYRSCADAAAHALTIPATMLPCGPRTG